MLTVSNHVRTATSPKRGKNGIFSISRTGYRLRAVVSDSRDWESVVLSVEGKPRAPSWDDVLAAKATFWSAGDDVVQLYAPKAYRPGHRTLTLWRSKVPPTHVPPGMRWTRVEPIARPATLPPAQGGPSQPSRVGRKAKPQPRGDGCLSPIQTAERAGIEAHLLLTWHRRYGFPPPPGATGGGIGVIPERWAENLREFVKAGRPFRQIVDGVWPPLQPARARELDWLAHFLGEVPVELLLALKGRQAGTVAAILAGSVRMRENKRAAVLACIRAANGSGDYSQALKDHAAAMR